MQTLVLWITSCTAIIWQQLVIFSRKWEEKLRDMTFKTSSINQEKERGKQYCGLLALHLYMFYQKLLIVGRIKTGKVLLKYFTNFASVETVFVNQS